VSARDDGLDPKLERVLGAHVDPRPDPRFERELRARFVGGTAPRRAPQPTRRALWIPLAVAAGAALGLGLWWRGARSEPAPWRVLEAAAGATLDGAALSPAALAAGGRLRTGPAGGVRLVLGRHVALSLGADSELVLPAVDSLEGPQAWLLEAPAGHLAIATGPDFPGSRLAVRAPDAQVEVVGTRFAVDVYESGTCVCCSEGRVQVTSRREGAEGAGVPAGGMAYAHSAGGLSTGEVMPDHVAPLDALEGVFE